MIDSIKTFITSFEFVSFLALVIYWTPLAICLATYFFRWIGLYHRDLKQCNEKFYSPQLTVGLMIGHVLLSVIPCINLFALVFDCASSVLGWIGRAFDMPLVRARYVEEPK